MHITHARPFRCHYRHAVPGQAPLALFVQLRARDVEHARLLAEAALGRQIERVEPAPSPVSSLSPVKEN